MKINTVKELIDALSEFDPNARVAIYSNAGECDFGIESIENASFDGDGIDGYYCQGDSEFYGESGPVVVISGGSR